MNHKATKYPCPICATKCLPEPIGSYYICPTCGWEDDDVSHMDPDGISIHPVYSLNEARRAWENGETLYERYPNPKGKKE